ncbi:MAG TPA: hypothetical protein VK745_14805 [Polyangiaceae bacterium]|nr:hypothetical protein [Polyangiaceae bacterium]
MAPKLTATAPAVATAPAIAATPAVAAVAEVVARAALPPPLPIVRQAAPPPLPEQTAPPPLPVAYSVPTGVAAPRFQPTLSRNDELDVAMFDGAARRRRMQWTFALLALLGVAAAVAATIASHYRPM